MRRRLVAALVVILAVTGTLAASAKPVKRAYTVQTLATRLQPGPFYIDARVGAQVDKAALTTLVATHPTYRFAVLVTLPRGVHTPALLAQRLLRRLVSHGVTFVAVAQFNPATGTILLAGASQTYVPVRVAAAAAAAQRTAPGSVVRQLEEFAHSISTGQIAAPPAPAGSGSGGISIWVWFAVVVAILLATLAGLRLRARSRDRRRRIRGGSIGTARSFHLLRLDHLSHRHGELVRRLAEHPDDPFVLEHHQTAGAKLVALRRQLPSLFSPRELRTLSSELDQVEWHLEAAEALLEAREPPPRLSPDRPGLCFFTHEHGLGTVEVDLVKPDGSVAAVYVCPANAVALVRGEPPFVSTVHVAGRVVPWPAAPSWYGAAGWSTTDLPGLEYEGREIWGRDIPRRDQAGTPVAASEPPLPGDAAPLPGDAAPLADDAASAIAIAPGTSPPSDAIVTIETDPGAGTGPDAADAPPAEPAPPKRRRGKRSDASAPEAPAPEPSPPPSAEHFEELEAPPPNRLVEHARAVDDAIGSESDVTAEHPALDDKTKPYDPLADELPPWDDHRPSRDR